MYSYTLLCTAYNREGEGRSATLAPQNEASRNGKVNIFNVKREAVIYKLSLQGALAHIPIGIVQLFRI